MKTVPILFKKFSILTEEATRMGCPHFMQMCFHFPLLLILLKRCSVSGVGIFTNLRLPSAVYNPSKANYTDMYSFNFPKDSIFVFNNPTIINLGETDGTAGTLKGDNAKQDDLDVSKPNVLCKLLKVNEAIVITNYLSYSYNKLYYNKPGET